MAGDFDFVLDTPVTVRMPGRNRQAATNAVQDRLHQLALYVSNYLTHPRYGAEKQVGFARGDTLRPTGLREVQPGHYSFGAQGIVVDRQDLFKFLPGPVKDMKAVVGAAAKRRPGWLNVTINSLRATHKEVVARRQSSWQH
jgi:hypothetical protein